MERLEEAFILKLQQKNQREVNLLFVFTFFLFTFLQEIKSRIILFLNPSSCVAWIRRIRLQCFISFLSSFLKPEHQKEPKERFIATFQKAATSEYGDSWPAVLLDVLNQTEWAKEIIPRKGSAIKAKP